MLYKIMRSCHRNSAECKIGLYRSKTDFRSDLNVMIDLIGSSSQQPDGERNTACTYVNKGAQQTVHKIGRDSKNL